MEAVENKPTEDGAEKKKKIADDSGDENDEEKEKEPAKKKVKGDKSDECKPPSFCRLFLDTNLLVLLLNLS